MIIEIPNIFFIISFTAFYIAALLAHYKIHRLISRLARAESALTHNLQHTPRYYNCPHCNLPLAITGSPCGAGYCTHCQIPILETECGVPINLLADYYKLNTALCDLCG